MSKIINLSEASSIAIHGMILIARSEKPLNVLYIADQTNSSKHHVAKILQRLSKEGFLTSLRGPAGGFSLNVNPAEIDLLTIYQAIEGKLEPGKCPMDKPVCTYETCIYNNVIEKMTEDFTNHLKSKKLIDYIKNPVTNTI